MTGSPPYADDAIAPTAHGGGTDFDRLYADHFGYVWRCLRGLGVPDAALDDAAQDVFVVVHRQLAGFRGQSMLRTWLFGILRNVASNHRRSVRRREPDRQPVDADLVSSAPTPLERAQHAQAARFVQEFLARLNKRKREVFVLAVLEEMSVPEVATTLQIRLNTAYTRLRAARADFRRALSGYRGTT